MPFSKSKCYKHWLILIENFISYDINFVTTLSLWYWRLHEFYLQMTQFSDPYLEPCFKHFFTLTSGWRNCMTNLFCSDRKYGEGSCKSNPYFQTAFLSSILIRLLLILNIRMKRKVSTSVSNYLFFPVYEIYIHSMLCMQGLF